MKDFNFENLSDKEAYHILMEVLEKYNKFGVPINEMIEHLFKQNYAVNIILDLFVNADAPPTLKLKVLKSLKWKYLQIHNKND